MIVVHVNDAESCVYVPISNVVDLKSLLPETLNEPDPLFFLLLNVNIAGRLSGYSVEVLLRFVGVDPTYTCPSDKNGVAK